MSVLTTAEGHIAILTAIIANIVLTITAFRSLHKKINGHLNGTSHDGGGCNGRGG